MSHGSGDDVQLVANSVRNSGRRPPAITVHGWLRLANVLFAGRHWSLLEGRLASQWMIGLEDGTHGSWDDVQPVAYSVRNTLGATGSMNRSCLAPTAELLVSGQPLVQRCVCVGILREHRRGVEPLLLCGAKRNIGPRFFLRFSNWAKPCIALLTVH